MIKLIFHVYLFCFVVASYFVEKNDGAIYN